MSDGAAGRTSGELARRHSTATVLFHHAVAEALGLGPSDHKCLDVLRERGAMTGSELAAAVGLTTGAVTGAVQVAWRSRSPRRRATRDTVVAVRTPEGWLLAQMQNTRVRPQAVPAPDAAVSRLARRVVALAARAGLGRSREVVARQRSR